MVEKLCVVTANNDFLANLCSYFLNTYMFFLIAVHMPNEKSKYDVRFICFNLFVGGRMSYLRYLCLFVFVCVQWCSTHLVLCFCFVFLRLVYLMLPIALDFPIFIDR